jgi:hypothetical protein
MVVNAYSNTLVAGERYSMSLEDVERFLEEA